MGPNDFCDLDLDIGQVQFLKRCLVVQRIQGLSPRELPEDVSLFVCSDEIFDIKILFHLLIISFIQDH